MNKPILLAVLLLLLTACAAPPATPAPAAAASTSSPTPAFTPTVSTTPSLTSRPTSTPRPPVPTRTPRPSPTHSPSPTPTLTLTYGALGEPLWIENYWGIWSPVALEMVSVFGTSPDTGVVALAAAPDFIPQPVDVAGANFKRTDFMWSLDGKRIYFGGPNEYYRTHPEQIDTISTLWVMDRTGRNARPVGSGEYGARYLTLYGWMDAQSLVTSEYEGGGHIRVDIVNVRIGQVEVSVGLHGYAFSPSARYVPAMEAYRDPYRLFVITRQRQPAGITTGMLCDETRYARLFPGSSPTGESGAFFKDWFPGKELILAQVYRYDYQAEKFLNSQLVAWDLSTDRTSLVAQHAVDGRYAPDGKTLAFVTLGPAVLDEALRLAPVPDGALPDEPPYLQLLDLASGQVFLSLPVRLDINTLDHNETTYDTDLFFSPDGRYLVFFTPGPLILDAAGWPQGVKAGGEEHGYMHVIDLREKKVVFSERAGVRYYTLPMSWSPKSDRLVFFAAEGNWRLLELPGGQNLPITLSGGARLKSPDWSFDGQYLALKVWGGYFEDIWPKTAIFRVP